MHQLKFVEWVIVTDDSKAYMRIMLREETMNDELQSLIERLKECEWSDSFHFAIGSFPYLGI
jgi:hypothetical protein